MRFVHSCCVGDSHTSYRVLAMRDLLGDAQDFMRGEFAKLEAHQLVKMPQAKFTRNSAGREVPLPLWTDGQKFATAPLVGFIATWSLDLAQSELVNMDFSSDSGCWDRRKTAAAAKPPRPRSIY